MKPNSSQRCTVTEQEATDKSWNMENSLDKDVYIYIYFIIIAMGKLLEHAAQKGYECLSWKQSNLQ